MCFANSVVNNISLIVIVTLYSDLYMNLISQIWINSLSVLVIPNALQRQKINY